ncbi:MAG TPA: ATP-binding cassette domain-containing protein [Candidatus Angelobacter sp.]|nr:ATP-binding cassette domain-containing protein [Candidatus Angelobacter sp.]
MNAIEVDRISKRYDDRLALDAVSFVVRRGEIFGFLGRNGAGKTTTIKILTTLVRPTHGKATVLGYDLEEFPLEIRKRTGLVQQRLSYEFSLPMEKQLQVYGRIWGLDREESKTRATSLIEKFGLKESFGKLPVEMSIGQRRRMQIARELMHEMDLLFLDEATTGLDVQTRRMTLDFFREKAREGLTIFFTTHILQEAESLCDRVGIIDQGRIVAIDSIKSLKSKYRETQTLEISATPVSEAISVIDKLGFAGSVSTTTDGDSSIRIKLRADESEKVISEVVAALVRDGVSITKISLEEPSLEDVFINLTSGTT